MTKPATAPDESRYAVLLYGLKIIDSWEGIEQFNKAQVFAKELISQRRFHGASAGEFQIDSDETYEPFDEGSVISSITVLGTEAANLRDLMGDQADTTMKRMATMARDLGVDSPVEVIEKDETYTISFIK